MITNYSSTNAHESEWCTYLVIVLVDVFVQLVQCDQVVELSRVVLKPKASG